MRFRQRFLVISLVGIMMGCVGIWYATPSTSDMVLLVHQVDATHHTVYMPLDAISNWVPRALIASEDEHFYQHHGIDGLGLLRAAWDDLRTHSLSEGGSTLDEQLAKNVYLNGDDRRLDRKLEAMVLAVKIDHRYRKDEILELYLNDVSFGDGAYGIAAAAWRYFGIRPAQMDLAQTALLIGLVRSPNVMDPWCHLALARKGQQAVLNRLVSIGSITLSQAQSALQESLPFTQPHPSDPYCIS
jgi:membrane peptidoglycan carboxypeptidase